MKDYLTRKVSELIMAESHIKAFIDKEGDVLSRIAMSSAKEDDRVSTASIIGARKKSIIAMETELPKILETQSKPGILSKSVLLDKSNLEKLKRY
jgi:hypothetical protein